MGDTGMRNMGKLRRECQEPAQEDSPAAQWGLTPRAPGCQEPVKPCLAPEGSRERSRMSSLSPVSVVQDPGPREGEARQGQALPALQRAAAGRALVGSGSVPVGTSAS